MVYSDGIHLVADTLDELHSFCESIGIKRNWFEGVRKGHPHYDIPFSLSHRIIFGFNVKKVSSREILAISEKLSNERI